VVVGDSVAGAADAAAAVVVVADADNEAISRCAV
jgi:hypothetical protein